MNIGIALVAVGCALILTNRVSLIAAGAIVSFIGILVFGEVRS